MWLFQVHYICIGNIAFNRGQAYGGLRDCGCFIEEAVYRKEPKEERNEMNIQV